MQSKEISLQQMATIVGLDAGHRSMRKAGRTKWNREDYNIATRESARLIKGVK